MSETITCPECKATLRLRDEYLGKKVKCPRCAHPITMPARQPAAASDKGITEVEPLPEPKTPKAETRSCPECGKKIAATAVQCRYCKADLAGAEESEEEEPVRRKSKYKPCPQCGGNDPKKVLVTWWGSFYGPKLFTHVRCRDCGYAYNGKTGRSNLIPAILFVTIPAILILGLIGLILYVFHSRGYF